MFLSQTTLLRWLNLLLGPLAVTLTVLFFWIYLFLLILVFALHCLSLHGKTLIILLYWFPLTFRQIQKRMVFFIAQFMTILLLIEASTAGTDFCECFEVGITVYISHRKYQFKLYLSSWFSTAVLLP